MGLVLAWNLGRGWARVASQRRDDIAGMQPHFMTRGAEPRDGRLARAVLRRVRVTATRLFRERPWLDSALVFFFAFGLLTGENRRENKGACWDSVVREARVLTEREKTGELRAEEP